MIRTFNEEARTSAPAILEAITEIERRDSASRGGVEGGPAGDYRGYRVLNTAGNDVGRVEDLYVDPNTRTPHYALLTLGNHAFGLGNRRVLVAYEDVEVISTEAVRVRVAVP